MEQVGLTYLEKYQVVLCRQHGSCVTPKQLKRHLWDLHRVRGLPVAEAQAEVDQLPLAEPTAVQYSEANGRPIEGLKTKTFFICRLSNCQGGPTARSQRLDTVRKHQSKDHGVGVRKTVKPTADDIEPISMQSFFLHPNDTWFQVRLPTPTAPRPLHPTPNDEGTNDDGPSDQMKDWWHANLASTQDAWQSQFNVFEDTAELHTSQTAPWLVRTGIAAFLEGLNYEKSELYQLSGQGANRGIVGSLVNLLHEYV